MRKNRILLYVISCLQGMVFYASIATLYRVERGVSLFQISVIESVSYALLLLLELPWGIVASRIGYKKSLLICNALYFVSKLVFWRADGFGMFMLERIMLAVVYAGLSGIKSGFLYENMEDKDSKQVFGVDEFMSTAGILLASLVYSFIINGHFALAALLTSVSYGLAAICTMFLNETKITVAKRTGSEDVLLSLAKIVNQIKLLWRLLPFLIASGILAEVAQFLTVFAGQLQYVASNIDIQWFGIIHILITLAGLAAGCTGYISKRYTSALLSITLFIIAALSCFSMALFRLPLLSVVAIMLLRAVSTMFIPIQLTVQNDSIDSHDRPLSLSVHSIVLSGISMVLNPLLGGASRISISITMWVSGGLCIAALFCLVYYLIKKPCFFCEN